MSLGQQEALHSAEEIFKNGKTMNPAEMFDLAKTLAVLRKFDYARKLVELIYKTNSPFDDKTFETEVTIRRASYLYRDTNLPIKYRLNRALKILQTELDLINTKNQEIIGLAGSICKRLWETEGDLHYLYRAMSYYQRGMKEGVKNDQGYSAINIAFVHDLLANQEAEEARKAGATSESAEIHRKEAERIREEIIYSLSALLSDPNYQWLKNQYWFSMTIAEAYFGLGKYDEALPWLKHGKEVITTDLGIEPTARQLATIARLKEPHVEAEHTHALKVISEFVGFPVTRDSFAGKIGLALSGGGFRASLFHIGVLGKLAELDMLRKIEVLSCVSGGSIIGAHYYLKVQRLLESKSDEQITRQDYIDLVAEIIEEFLAGVQQNIRTKAFSELKTNLKMAFSKDYSAAYRLGELFESEIFARASSDGSPTPLYMDELGINPVGEEKDFNSETSNWRRNAKVPDLILNATSLNTGYNWQFTNSGMGELTWRMREDNNQSTLYKFKNYTELPAPYHKFRLGHAVAASSCVPGMFGPLAMHNLYDEEGTVRLVDGGVSDNQGILGLFDRGCSVFLISDASQQFKRTKKPPGGLIRGAARSSGIQGRIVRDALFGHLSSHSNLLRGNMLVDIYKDLDDLDETCVVEDGDKRPLTCYGIPKEIQSRIALLRTDLDSFSEAEAYALMTSGYRMTEYEFRVGSMEGFAEPPSVKPDWKFLNIEEFMQPSTHNYAYLIKLLTIGASRIGRIFRLLTPLRYFSYFILALFGSALCYTLSTAPPFVITGATVLVLLVVLGSIICLFILIHNLEQIFIGLFFAMYGARIFNFHIQYLDKQYLRRGTLDFLRKKCNK
jgi:predicted acylesterase/phospholipase RssA